MIRMAFCLLALVWSPSAATSESAVKDHFVLLSALFARESKGKLND
jgi:hypothetical protein